jgi:acyl-CoA synthetase (AMP-forming)/AMP-acid ligase II
MSRRPDDSLQARFRKQLARRRDRAVAFMNPRGEVAWRTREQFFAQAAGAAGAFRDHGLHPGEVCLLVLQSDETCATALAGALLAGAVPLLIAPPTLQGTRSSLPEILARTARRTRARLAVLDESMSVIQGGLPGFDAPVVPGREILAAAPQDTSWVLPRATAIAAMQLTSGTTGFPRVCVWKQRGVLAALDGMTKAMQLSDDDICFNWTPLYHDMGLVNNFLLCLATGVPIVLLTPQDFVKQPALWLRGLHLTGATTTWSPNFGYALAAKQVADDDVRGVRLDGVRAFWNAAERIHLETMEHFRTRFTALGLRPDALKTNFGCAENVGGATFTEPNATFRYERVDRELMQQRRVAVPRPQGREAKEIITLVGAGRAAPGISITILSRTGRGLPDGHVGEIALKTPSRMTGYLRDRHATRRALFGSMLRTGDLGYLRDGELFWVGRVRERITVRGKKIDPSDLEPTLFKVPELRPGCFAAFGIDDPERGTQQLVVVSELRDGTAAHAAEIRRRVRAGITLDLAIEVGDVVLVPKGTLTKTSSGKRRHRHFRDLYRAGQLPRIEAAPDVAPGGNVASTSASREGIPAHGR